MNNNNATSLRNYRQGSDFIVVLHLFGVKSKSFSQHRGYFFFLSVCMLRARAPCAARAVTRFACGDSRREPSGVRLMPLRGAGRVPPRPQQRPLNIMNRGPLTRHRIPIGPGPACRDPHETASPTCCRRRRSVGRLERLGSHGQQL